MYFSNFCLISNFQLTRVSSDPIFGIKCIVCHSGIDQYSTSDNIIKIIQNLPKTVYNNSVDYYIIFTSLILALKENISQHVTFNFFIQN